MTGKPKPIRATGPHARDAIRRTSAAHHETLPETPPDWREHAVRLLGCPGLDPLDADTLRAWIAWRVLPRRYWARMQDMTAGMAMSRFADDFGSQEEVDGPPR